MPNIAVTMSGFWSDLDNPELLYIQGRSSAQGVVDDIGWNIIIPYTSNASQVNSACIQGAIDEWARVATPVIVTVADKKMLFCGVA